MATVFVSYRRQDATAWALLLRESFERNLPEVRVFRDIDSILPGDDFAETISDAVASCDALIAVIGPRWLDAVDDHTGKRRLFEPHDYTRIEIATALRRRVRVIPALVGGAAMPTRDQLPDDLQPLCERQNVELPDRSWHDACRRFAEMLAPLLRHGDSNAGSGKEQSFEAAILKEEIERAERELDTVRQRGNLGRGVIKERELAGETAIRKRSLFFPSLFVFVVSFFVLVLGSGAVIAATSGEASLSPLSVLILLVCSTALTLYVRDKIKRGYEAELAQLRREAAKGFAELEAREIAARARLDSLRSRLPPG